MGTKITFAQLNKMIVFGFDKTSNSFVYIDNCENGLSCNLFCNYCKSNLVARNGGNMREHHFAHQAGSKCKKGHESTIALMFKMIVDKTGYLSLPHSPYQEVKIPNSTSIVESRLIFFEEENVPVVELINNKNTKIAVVLYYDYTKSYSLISRAKQGYEYVIGVDLKQYKGTNLIVEDTIDKIVRERINKNWIKNKEINAQSEIEEQKRIERAKVERQKRIERIIEAEQQRRLSVARQTHFVTNNEPTTRVVRPPTRSDGHRIVDLINANKDKEFIIVESSGIVFKVNIKENASTADVRGYQMDKESGSFWTISQILPRKLDGGWRIKDN